MSNHEINTKDKTAFSNLHGQFESRLGSLETNAFTFIAVIISVFLGLGHVYTNSPSLLKITCATVGALMVLAFGIFHVQVTAHAFRVVHLIIWRLEKVLELDKVVPKNWNPVPGIRKGLHFNHIPEMLKVQFIFYIIMGIAVVILLWVWIYETQSNCLFFIAVPHIFGLVFYVFFKFYKWNDERLIGKRIALLNENEI